MKLQSARLVLFLSHFFAVWLLAQQPKPAQAQPAATATLGWTLRKCIPITV